MHCRAALERVVPWEYDRPKPLFRHREEAMTRKASPLLIGIAAAIAATVALPLIAAEPKPGSAPDKASADPPAQNFAIEHEVGRRFRIDPNELPAPKTGP